MEARGPSSPQIYLLSLLLVVPYLFFFHKAAFSTTPRLQESSTLLRPLLTIFVVLHSLHTLKLLLSPPVNLFTKLNLPLTAPVSAIRVALLESQKAQFPVGFLNKLPPEVEVLLSRLASFEARVIYVKYGPYPLSYCTACVYLSDFALFALAPSVLPYLRAIILVSLMTSRPALRPAWRTPSLVVLVAALATEAWWTLDGTVQFREGKLEGWTHTHTYISRHVLLLLLPLVVHHLPEHSSLSPLPPFVTCAPPRVVFPHQSSDFRLANEGSGPRTPQRGEPAGSTSTAASAPAQAGPSSNSAAQTQGSEVPGGPSTPVTTLSGTISSLSTTINTLRVLEWARIAGLRRDSLREKMSSYYETESLEATYARSDDRLRREAERLGMGYGKERERFPAGARFGGSSSTWQGKGDPRGLDGDSVVENDEEDEFGDGRYQQRERERREKEAELAQSPLRAKARKMAQELAQKFFWEGRRGS